MEMVLCKYFSSPWANTLHYTRSASLVCFFKGVNRICLAIYERKYLFHLQIKAFSRVTAKMVCRDYDITAMGMLKSP